MGPNLQVWRVSKVKITRKDYPPESVGGLEFSTVLVEAIERESGKPLLTLQLFCELDELRSITKDCLPTERTESSVTYE
jgi:hypothetical protein